MNLLRNISIEEECGVTSASLQNAEKLIAAFGKPVTLSFTADTNRGDYFVEAVWLNGVYFKFSGFAWGYGGTGPQGLNRFLNMVGCFTADAYSLPIDRFGKTDLAWFSEEFPEDASRADGPVTLAEFFKLRRPS